MAKKQKCSVCESPINLDQKDSFLKCPFCITFAHNECAEKENEIFSEHFYCKDHRYMRPSNAVRTPRPSKPVEKTGAQEVLRNLAAASQIFQSQDPEERISLSPEEVESLNTSITFLNEIFEQNKVQKDSSHKNATNEDPSATSTTINSIEKETVNKKDPQPINRAPNFPPAYLMMHPFTPECIKCLTLITKPFFKCLNCKQCWHDRCVIDNDRHKQIKGYWACSTCHSSYEEHERIINYSGDQQSMLQKKNAREAEMYSNLKIDDPHFSRNRISQYPFRFPVPTGSTYPKGQQSSRESNPQETASMGSKKLDEMRSERLRIEKAIKELSTKKNQLDEHINGSSNCAKAFRPEKIDNAPRNDPVRSHSSHDLTILSNESEIQRIVEASLRKLNTKQQDDSNELSRKLIENQIRESQKKTYYLLPKVTKIGYEWKIFYTAFLDSMNIFTPNENVVRLQNAIQCPEIKKLGGINLFTSATYEQTLKDIDKRIGKPEKMLLREKQKLIGLSKLGNNDTKEIMDFIQEVKAYSTLVDKIGNFGDKNDQALIARLSRILPDRLLNTWTKEYSKIKEETEEVLVNDLSSWLDKQIDTFETSLLFNQMDPYGDLKPKNAKHPAQQNPKAKETKKENLFFHKSDEAIINNNQPKISPMNHSTNGDNDSPAKFCWYHKKKGHSSLICFTLLSKNGDEVQELARSKGICTICSSKTHHPCPQKEKFACPIPECPENHALIFCPKRRQQKITTIPTRSRAPTSHNPRNRRTEVNHSHNIQERTQSDAAMSQTTFNALQFSMRNNDDDFNSFWMMREISMHANCQSNLNAYNQIPASSSSLVSVLTLILESHGKTLKCALLLDSGSTTSLLDEEFADLLHLEGPTKELKLAWSGGKNRIVSDSKIVKAKATGIHENAKTFDIYFRTVKNLGMPSQDFNAEEMRKKFSHLKDLPLISYSRLIGVIGTDQWRFFKQQKFIESQNKNSIESPVAFLTPLGYCVIGASCSLSKLHEHMSSIHIEESSISHNTVKLNENEEEELIKMEQSALGLDYRHPYENDRAIEEEQAGLKALIEKVKFLPDEKVFEAPLLWNTPNVLLPTEDSFKTSYRRLKILLNNAERTGKFDEIKGQVNNLIDKGYARKLTQDEIKKENPKAFYIPIFISCPKGKRARMIWDCAAKINGKSLNDYLYTGPNLYTDLFDIIIRFREGKYFVKADVMEMFHQIQIRPEDRPALRFLFASSLNGQVEHYEMKRMIFGSACSPTTSQFVKNHIAKSYESSFPEASKAIIESMYVDDFVHSFNDINYGKKLVNDAHKILKSGGFSLVKMRANNPVILETVIQNLSDEDRSNPKLLSKEDKEKLLGHFINYKHDTVALVDFREKFSTSFLDGTKVPTKKDLLKFLMSFYDPIGFFVFFTSKIKLIYHWVCKDKIDWDEQISEKQIKYWNKILKWLPEILKLEIPRSYLNNLDINSNETLRYQLIIMGDAGKESLCTVAYIRILNEKNIQVGTQFVASKNFIVPIKQKRTIPELELDIACKSVQFKEKLIKAHSIKFDQIFFLTDSSCVYSWIVTGANKPTVYMNNRLNKINELSTKDQWSWISTELQVADYGTKFESFPQLEIKNEWFEPNIFRLPEENWLHSKPPNDTQQEFSHHMRHNEPVYEKYARLLPIKFMISYLSIIFTILQTLPYYKTIVNTLKLFTSKCFPKLFQLSQSYQMWLHTIEYKDSIQLSKRYSSWNKLLKMTQLILRWQWKVKIKRATSRQCNVEEIRQWESHEYQEKYAEMTIIRKAQMDCYLEEIKMIKKGNRVGPKNKLHKHNPFLDEFGILRVTTRLSAANNYSRDKITPIVLPSHHKITELIVMHFHHNNHHSHYKTIISNLLQRFHIPNIAWTTRRIIKANCFKCKKFNAKPDVPLMGDLPSYRLASHTDPFTYSIVDVCGPFTITMNRRHQKRWLFVISCLTTRAIHIEILYSMAAQSCLMAFQNFITLRGAPLRVLSDRGSNFLGAKNILHEMETKWNQKLKEKGVITQTIEWDFSPAKASSMNGSVERMIGLIKNVLRNLHETLNKKFIIPGDEEFRCLICEIIGMLNNRPLTMLPIKDTNNCFLTPNYFLQLRPNFQSCPSNKSFNKCMIKEWQDVKGLVNVLWDHFNRAYVNEIMHRDKWIDFKKPLCVGDVVVLADPSINNLWRLGVIMEVHEGSQNQTRKVTVRLGKRSVINDHSNKNRVALMKEYKKETFTEVTRPTSQVAPLNLFVSERCHPNDHEIQ